MQETKGLDLTLPFHQSCLPALWLKNAHTFDPPGKESSRKECGQQVFPYLTSAFFVCGEQEMVCRAASAEVPYVPSPDTYPLMFSVKVT